MRLRNKKTREIVDLWHGSIDSDMNGENIIISPMKPDEKAANWSDKKYHEWSYTSLAKLNEEWEDAKPVEPLIKDEKIRKAVRAWAETNQAKFITCSGSYTAFDNRGLVIEFSKRWATCMANGNHYTITELCGEEEE